MTPLLDSVQYGPWAGKMLVSAEQFPGEAQVGMLYTIDPNGTVTGYNLGICEAEDLDLIPAGQNLYGIDLSQNGSSTVFKVPAGNFANFAGDILVTHENEPTALDIVHWDGSRFVVRSIPVNAISLEHSTFAPIDIPGL